MTAASRNGRIPRQIEPRGSHPVPFVIGNLGAAAIIATARGRPLASEPLLADLPRLAALGIDAVEDYVGWNVVEPQEGTRDFALHRAHREEARRLGLGYVVYPWVHALPGWLADSGVVEPFRCVEHGLATIHPSIFARSTLALYDRFYSTLAAELGADLEAVTLALPCDYGEVGYPTGMGSWVLDAEGPHVHRHTGFWCGDDSAVRAFRHHVLSRFGSRDAVNAIFGTAFRRDEEIRPLAPPDLDAGSDRFRFEVIAWYRAALLDFVRAITAVARRHFPAARLAIKCGYAGELAAFGQDYTRLVPLAAELGLTLWSTHGTLPTIFHKRIRSLCSLHGVPYFTESPTERTLEQVRDRLFEDAADGAEGFFEFHDTFREFEREFVTHRALLRGERPREDLAVLFHSTAQILEPGRSLPPGLFALGEPLRDLTDFAVLDEETLTVEGALDRKHVLLVTDPGPLLAPAIAAMTNFARRGGIVVLPASPASAPLGGTCPDLVADPSLCARLPAELLRLETGSSAAAIRFGEIEDAAASFGEFVGPELAAPYFATPRHPHARWTGGHAGFRLPRPTRDGVQLVVQFYVDAHALRRPVSLRCDGELVTTIREPGSHLLRFDLAVARERAVLEFEVECTPFRPSDHGSSDRRELGVLLHYAAVDDESSPGTPRFLPRLEFASLPTNRVRPLGAGAVVFAPARDPLALIACTLAALRESARRSAAPWRAPNLETRIARFPDRILELTKRRIEGRSEPGEIRETSPDASMIEPAPGSRGPC